MRFATAQGIGILSHNLPRAVAHAFPETFQDLMRTKGSIDMPFVHRTSLSSSLSPIKKPEERKKVLALGVTCSTCLTQSKNNEIPPDKQKKRLAS